MGKERDDSSCIFCSLNTERIITQNNHAFAVYDKYPVNKGHTLVIPHTHIANYFDLPEDIRNGCWNLVDKVYQRLSEKLSVEHFNIGVNIGSRAGQTIFHAHIHLIPRFPEDVEDPTGGVRNVRPGKGNYTA